MVFEFLQPVEEVVQDFLADLSVHTIGHKIAIHTSDNFPELENVKIVILGIKENRGDINFRDEVDLTKIRKELYQLFPGNWNCQIADIGNIHKGESITDTYFLVKEVVADLLKQKIIPVVLGGTQDLTYALYRAYDLVEQMVNIAVIDSRFDFGNEIEENTNQSYLSKIIINEPNNLFNFSNLGYQVYYNPQHEIDLMDDLYFDAYRLGDVSANITLAEPVFRGTDLVSLDMQSIQSSQTGNYTPSIPNGFNGKEVCSLSRYAGISDKVTVFGVFNHQNTIGEASLIAQVVWYFIEGVNFRSNEYPFGSKEDYLKYTVLVEDLELVFYKSNVTERWWIEIPTLENRVNRLQTNTLLPCMHQDYLKACENEIPERWWKAYRKNIL